MSTCRLHSPFSQSLSIVLLLALLLTGCGAAAEAPAAMESAAAPAASDRAAMEASSGESAQSSAALPSDGSSQSTALLNRKMVARATLDMVVADAGETVSAIETLMGEVGGFISSENLYNEAVGGDAPRLRGSLTLRVPAEALESTMAQLEALAVEVGNRTMTREDVTDQYTDLDAQLRNLEATEAELLEMLAEVRAKPNAKPEDILAVHNRVSEIRGQIEQAQGRKNMLDNLIGLSTIDVYLAPDRSSLPVVESGWQPGMVARDALRLLVSTLQGLANVAIWMAVYVLPAALVVLLPLVLLGLIVWWFLRRRRRRAAIGEQ
jgi:hypothetical protein